jgi:RHS repeat-associated protein
VTEGGSTLARFQYDAEGRLLKKIGAPTYGGDTGVRQYVYDQTSRLLEYDGAGATVARFSYGSDRLISMWHLTEGTRFYHLDGLRSVTALSDTAGAVTARLHLDAWGNFRFPTDLTASANRFAFTGHVFDTETGLYNAKARYFDPKLGRFLTQDSFLGQIDEPPSLHRYLYANDNPTTFIDPTGHYSLREFGQDVKWGLDFGVAFQQEFSARAGETAANIATLGGYGGVKKAYNEGRVTATDFWSAGRAYAEGVYNTVTLGGGERAIAAYAEGKGAGGIALEATKGVGETLLPINEVETVASSKKNIWEKAEAVAVGVTKLAGLAAGGAAFKNRLASKPGIVTEGTGAEAAMAPTEGTLAPAAPRTYAVGERMPNGRLAGEGPGAAPAFEQASGRAAMRPEAPSSAGGTVINKGWKSLIEGKAHGTTAGHRFRSYRKAIEMAKSGQYERVYVNRGYRASTGAKVTPNRRPDVTGIRTTGEVDVVEIPQATDVPAALRARNVTAQQQLPPEMRGRIDIEEIQ